MKKVLIVNTIGFGYEGISAVILNYCTNIDKSGLELHVVCSKKTSNEIIRLLENNAVVHILPSRKKELVKYIVELNLILDGKFDVIHINGNSATMCLETVLAKLHGIKTVIVHGHASSTSHPKINTLLRPLLLKTSNVKLACSNLAGNFLYRTGNYCVLNNAIDTTRFLFDGEKRSNTRANLNITSQFVVGHVGYFSENKNQSFLLELLYEIKSRGIYNLRFLFIGNHFDTGEFERKVKDLNVEDYVIVVPANNNIELYYNAMDLFLFPSKHEGLGLALVEAQANGLHCLASTGVPQTGNVSQEVEYIDLSDKDMWINSILKTMDKQYNNSRIETSMKNVRLIEEKGFDIRQQAGLLRTIYMGEKIL